MGDEPAARAHEAAGPVRAYIAVGSNIEPEKHIAPGLAALARRVRIVAVSSFYYAEPAGGAHGPRFLNGVIAADVECSARHLKYDVIRPIEADQGRQRGPDPNAPRTLDLDIVLFGDARLDEPDLVVPDPEALIRPFIYWPLRALAPDVIWPGLGRPLAQIPAPAGGDSLQSAEKFTDLIRIALAVDK